MSNRLLTDAEILDAIKTLGAERQATYSGSASEIYIIFNNQVDVSSMIDGEEVSNRVPMAMGREVDLYGSNNSIDPFEKTLTIDSVVYYIINNEPDGEGFVELTLSQDNN